MGVSRAQRLRNEFSPRVSVLVYCVRSLPSLRHYIAIEDKSFDINGFRALSQFLKGRVQTGSLLDHHPRTSVIEPRHKATLERDAAKVSR
jgi:hypothetical protein